jgi:hypothetical protein
MNRIKFKTSETDHYIVVEAIPVNTAEVSRHINMLRVVRKSRFKWLENYRINRAKLKLEKEIVGTEIWRKYYLFQE